MQKIRLDQLIVERGLASSRDEAKRLILAGQIRLPPGADPKPGRSVDPDLPVEFIGKKSPYVSRGGLKLAAALERFGVAPKPNALAIDIGASTGGFTDCLLQHGAARVLAIDTGKGKIHEKLRADPRVRLMENCNARHLDLAQAGGEPADLIAIDVSFISLRLILPAAARLLAEGGSVVALVKPQFEAGRKKIGSGGIVRDPKAHEEVLNSLAEFCAAEGWKIAGAMASPILGAEGNVEFFFHLARGAESGANADSRIDSALRDALEEAARLRAKE